MPKSLPLNEKIYRNTDASAGPDGCWWWVGCVGRHGYGTVGDRGVVLRAHRAAYELHNEVKLSRDQFVCHACDNKMCVNPAHLWVGTAKENTRYFVDKGLCRPAVNRKHWKHI